MLSLYNVCVCLSVRTIKHFIIIIITGIIILNQVAMFCWPAGGVCPAVEEGRDHPGRGGEGHQLCGYQDIYSACKYQGLNDHQFCWLQWRTRCLFFLQRVDVTYVVPVCDSLRWGGSHYHEKRQNNNYSCYGILCLFCRPHTKIM